jgi:glycosidase
MFKSSTGFSSFTTNVRIFKNLLNETHKRGLHLIMDMVLNHTSTEHPWFQEAKKSKDNPYHDYYLWQNPVKNGKKPNNWLSTFSNKTAWNTWDHAVSITTICLQKVRRM